MKYLTLRNNCITEEYGKEVFNFIKPLLMNNEQIELNFKNAHVFNVIFFNHAIGQLLKFYTSDDIHKYIKIRYLNEDGKFILRRVIDNAKVFYKQK